MTRTSDYLAGFVDSQGELEHYIRRRAAEVPSLDPTAPHHRSRLRALVEAGIGSRLDSPRASTTWLPLSEPTTSQTGVRTQRVALTTGGRHPLPAILYRPPAGASPSPGVLFLSGHAALGKDEPSFAHVCLRLAEAGCVVLAPEPWAQGERVGAEQLWGVEAHTLEGIRRWWGDRWLVAEMLLEYRCALDVLESLSEVDADQLGVTGVSGGGWMTTLLMAVEPRLHAAAIATFITSRAAYRTFGQAQDAEQHLVGAAELDHGDFIAAMAPRPVAVLAAKWDFFPIEGTFDSVAYAQAAYSANDAADQLRIRTADCGHGYSPALREDAIEFFAESFGLPVPERRLEAPAETDSTPGRRAEEWALLPAVAYTAMHPRSAEWLRETVSRGRRTPQHTSVRWVSGRPDAAGVFWRSETDLSCGGVACGTAPATRAAQGRLSLVLTPHGTDDRTEESVQARLKAAHGPDDGPMVHLDLRGQGALRAREGATTPGAELGGIADDPTYRPLCELLWLGDSLMAGRVYDLLRAVEVLLEDATLAAGWQLAAEVQVLTLGDGPRLCAELAATLDPRVVPVPLDGDGVDVRERLDRGGDDWVREWWEWVLPGWLQSPA